jgi:hypothetical protein
MKLLYYNIRMRAGVESFFAWGAGRRLILAGGLAIALWGAVGWAVGWWW